MQDLQPQCVAVYINLITVYSLSLKQPTKGLEEVFQHLESSSLRVSVGKANMAQDAILVLRHRVSAAGIEQNHEKVEVILIMPPPNNTIKTKEFRR